MGGALCLSAYRFGAARAGSALVAPPAVDEREKDRALRSTGDATVFEGGLLTRTAAAVPPRRANPPSWLACRVIVQPEDAAVGPAVLLSGRGVAVRHVGGGSGAARPAPRADRS